MLGIVLEWCHGAHRVQSNRCLIHACVIAQEVSPRLSDVAPPNKSIHPWLLYSSFHLLVLRWSFLTLFNLPRCWQSCCSYQHKSTQDNYLIVGFKPCQQCLKTFLCFFNKTMPQCIYICHFRFSSKPCCLFTIHVIFWTMTKSHRYILK